MNTTLKAIGGLVIVLLTIACIYFLNVKKENVQPLGSVARGQEYQSITFHSASTQGSENVLKDTGGALGSVVVTVAGAGSFELYDATTTNSALRANTATSSLRKVASFGTSQAVGTYTFDNVFFNGLVRGTNGAQGTTTITFR